MDAYSIAKIIQSTTVASWGQPEGRGGLETVGLVDALATAFQTEQELLAAGHIGVRSVANTPFDRNEFNKVAAEGYA